MNLAAGIEVGLHTYQDIFTFSKTCDFLPKLNESALQISSAKSQLATAYTDIVRRKRYSGPGSDDTEQRRVNALNNIFPCAFSNAERLDGETLYRVVPHTSLMYLIDHSYWRKRAVANLDLQPLPRNAKEVDIREWCEALGSLPDDERRFKLPTNGRLSNGIVWFTRAQDMPDDSIDGPSEKRAQASRDRLGLVHLKPAGRDIPLYLFSLRFPGVIADRVGHYRPSAFDSLDNSRFMVPRNKSEGVPELHWGRTADLASIQSESKPVRGAPERVSNQIWEEDMKGSEVSFTLLGELKTRHRIGDKRFAERLGASV
ncbi:hypothetical protein [Neorhizobium sp. T7_12]|uniref:hypothetical protein n=1 Tax=Neorhizobium sp. T7_12 TaxID=2093832 RepID=UPI000CF8CDB0|nr:hypothetical protein [Neorhizobium sp. T7_12]